MIAAVTSGYHEMEKNRYVVPNVKAYTGIDLKKDRVATRNERIIAKIQCLSKRDSINP